jgi:phage terminase small subunit
MTNALTVATPQDRSYDGKAMAALTDRQRQFVQAMLQQGVNPKAASKAAAQCGYAPLYGYELMRNDNILAALREEATKRLVGAALVGVNVLLDIAQSPTHKDQFRAAKELAGINGFTAEQRIMVTHVTEDTKQQMRQIRDMAEQLGMDPQALIAAAGIVDAEFTEVTVENGSQQAMLVDDSEW